MRCVPGLDVRLPRPVEAMMRSGDRAGARRALSEAAEVSRPFADGVLRLWCLRQAHLEAAAVVRSMSCAVAVDERQLPLFAELDQPVRGCV
jgi:hypothetical protein